MTAEELQQAMPQFIGTENYYRHWLGLYYTDGVAFVAENAGAYWLIDIIASYQPANKLNPRLYEFQLWILHVKDGKGYVECKADSDIPAAITQEIPFTDFPLPELRLYVSNGVLMLPSEY